jgi:hypothetical protein
VEAWNCLCEVLTVLRVLTVLLRMVLLRMVLLRMVLLRMVLLPVVGALLSTAPREHRTISTYSTLRTSVFN